MYRRVVGSVNGVVEFTLFDRAGGVVDSFTTNSADNGDVPVTEVRWGSLNSIGSSQNIRFDDVTVTTVDAPAIVSVDGPAWLVDARGSTGVVSLAQVSGDVVPVLEPVPGLFVIDLPVVRTGWLKFDVSAGGVVSEQFLIPPSNLSGSLVFVGGDPAVLSNWK